MRVARLTFFFFALSNLSSAQDPQANSAEGTASVLEVIRQPWLDAEQQMQANIWGSPVSPDGKCFMGFGDAGPRGGIRIWDLTTGEQLHEFLTGKDVWFSGASFMPGGKQIVTSYSNDKVIYLWDVATEKVVREFRGHKVDGTFAAVSHDGRRLVSSGKDNSLRLWDVETAQEIWNQDIPGEQIGKIAFSPDDTLILTTGSEPFLQIRKVDSGVVAAKLTGHTKNCSGDFSPDGKQVLSWGEDGLVRIWEAESGQVVRSFAGQSGPVRQVWFLDEGRQIMIWDKDMAFRIWNCANGQVLRQIKVNGFVTEGFVHAVLSPNGRRLLVTDTEGDVRLLDVSTGRELHRSVRETMPKARGFSFSPDGRHVTAGSFRQGMYLIHLPDPPISKEGDRELDTIAAIAMLGGSVPTLNGQPTIPVTKVTFPANDDRFRDEHVSLLSAFKDLQELTLNSNGIADEGLQQIRQFSKLKSLSISRSRITDAGLKDINSLGRLTRLKIADSQITDVGLKEIAQLSQLHTLSLSHCKITDTGIRELAACKNLISLDVEATSVSLNELTTLPKLALLSVKGSQVGDSGLNDIAKLRSLTFLKLSGGVVTEPAVHELAQLPELTTLELDDSRVEDTGLKELVHFKKLKSLSLAGTSITDASLHELKFPASLVTLNLNRTDLTEAGIHELESSTLSSLSLDQTLITSSREQVKKMLPNVKSVTVSPSNTLFGTPVFRFASPGAPLAFVNGDVSNGVRSQTTQSAMLKIDGNSPQLFVKIADGSSFDKPGPNLVRRRPQYKSPITDWSFSPDGKLVAVVSAIKDVGNNEISEIYVWEVATGKCLMLLDSTADSKKLGKVTKIAFSEDGKTLLYE